MNSTIYISRDRDGNVSVIPNPADSLRKSVGDRRTIAMTCVDLCQVGRDEMSATEKFLNGGAFQALLPRTVTMLTDEPTLREIREGLMRKSVDSVAELDAGRGRLSDILALFPEAVLKGGESLEDFDEDGNTVGQEPLQKGVDRGLFDHNHALLQKGGGLELVRLAYSEHASDPATSAGELKKAADELDALTARMGR